MGDFFTQEGGGLFFGDSTLYDDAGNATQAATHFATAPADLGDELGPRRARRQESAGPRCEVCGGADFATVDGRLVCQQCGTQSQRYVETQQDDDWIEMLTGAFGQRRLRVVGVRKADADLCDPLFRVAKRTTFAKALRVLLTEHVRAMVRPAREGGRICAPAELKDVVDRLWESWTKQQSVSMPLTQCERTFLGMAHLIATQQQQQTTEGQDPDTPGTTKVARDSGARKEAREGR